MARPKKIVEQISDPQTEWATIPARILPLTQEFNHISEMNILRDKINEIIKQL